MLGLQWVQLKKGEEGKEIACSLTWALHSAYLEKRLGAQTLIPPGLANGVLGRSRTGFQQFWLRSRVKRTRCCTSKGFVFPASARVGWVSLAGWNCLAKEVVLGGRVESSGSQALFPSETSVVLGWGSGSSTVQGAEQAPLLRSMASVHEVTWLTEWAASLSLLVAPL